MSCLQDIYCGKRVIIGVKDFNECEEPESGLYINGLRGISLKTAANIAPAEYQTGNAFLRDTIITATKLVVKDFTSAISNNFDFNSILANRELNDFSTERLAKENVDRGLVLRRWRSELANIYIENLYIQSADSGIAIIDLWDDVYIVDGMVDKSRARHKQYQVSLQANTQMEFPIEYRAKGECVLITVNNANFRMYTGPIYNNNSVGCNSCSGGRSEDLYVSGWDGTYEIDQYYGLGVSASVRCYEDAAICKLMDRLYFAIWYRAGIEVCLERIHGNRINNIATFDKDKAEKLMEYFWAEYAKQKKDFATNSKTFLRTLTADCITCNSMRHAQRVP